MIRLSSLFITILLLGLYASSRGQENGSTISMDTGNRLLMLINLDHPGLSAMKGAKEKGDHAAAKRLLGQYYLQRSTPQWPVQRAARPAKPVVGAVAADADKVLKRQFEGFGTSVRLPKIINWDHPFEDAEWTAALNEHSFWGLLGRAYWETHDEKYAEDFVLQLRGWLAANPVLDKFPARCGRDGKLCPWRNELKAATRMSGPWFDAFCYFYESPAFTVDDKMAMLYSIAQHAEYLTLHRGVGNAEFLEASALLRMSVLFPEFKNSPQWRAAALSRLSDAIDQLVYPDGAEVELSPHYHLVSLSHIMQVVEFARDYNIDLPLIFSRKLEKMYEYCMMVTKPDLTIPLLNDSDIDQFDMAKILTRGSALFNRKDMLFVATGGRLGKRPADTSSVLPYAGLFIMRSGWERNARYLLFEAGPFGRAHHHEDKLQIDVYAYGRSLLFDPGRYTYVPGPWRQHFLGTSSHNTIMVDGKGQQRSQADSRFWVTDRPLQNKWVSNAVIDFAAGSYTDGYGGRAWPIHTRRVLFVKNDYWVVSDRLYDKEGAHSYNFASQFQYSSTGVAVDRSNGIARSANSDGNLMLIPVSMHRVATELFEGQVNPPRGWIGWSYHNNRKSPASQIVYSWQQPCPTGLDVVLYPYPGKESPRVNVKRLAAHGPETTALEVSTPYGRDLVVMQHTAPREILVEGIRMKAETAVYRYNRQGRLSSSFATPGGSIPLDTSSDSGAGSPVRRFNLDIINAGTVKLTWDSMLPVLMAAEFGHSEGGGYLFSATSEGKPNRSGALFLSNLSPGMSYKIRVLGYSGEGKVVFSKEVTVTLPTNQGAR